MLNLNYDSSSDVLYIGLADKSNSYGDEVANGYVLLIDNDTDEITGLTIFDFMYRYNNGILTTVSLPVHIDYTNDVVPYIMPAPLAAGQN